MNKYEAIRITRQIMRECRSHTKCEACAFYKEVGGCHLEEWLNVKELKEM